MNEILDDESYARVALTYLAEPADRVLGALLRVHGAARTLEAIKSAGEDGGVALAADEAAVRRAMERWRVRLSELPSAADILAFRRSGIRLICPGDPRQYLAYH